MALLEIIKSLGVETYPGVDHSVIERQEADLGLFPKQLKELYQVSNGIDLEWFKVYPIETERDIKRTWDSIARANNSETSKYLSDDSELLSRFLIFAELSGPDFAAIDREDGTIWFSEHGDLVQLEMDLLSFISAVVKEVNEL